jgi:hypothetical protein
MSNLESTEAAIGPRDLIEPVDLRDEDPVAIGILFGEASRLIRYVRNRSPYFRAMAILKQYEDHLAAFADEYNPPALARPKAMAPLQKQHSVREE